MVYDKFLFSKRKYYVIIEDPVLCSSLLVQILQYNKAIKFTKTKMTHREPGAPVCLGARSTYLCCPAAYPFLSIDGLTLESQSICTQLSSALCSDNSRKLSCPLLTLSDILTPPLLRSVFSFLSLCWQCSWPQLTYLLTSVWPQQHPCTPSAPYFSCMVFLVGWASLRSLGANRGTRGRLSCSVKGPVRGHPRSIQKDVTQHILHNVNILPNSQHLLTMDDCAQPSYCVLSQTWTANLW